MGAAGITAMREGQNGRERVIDVSRCSKKIVPHNGRSTLTVILTCVAWWSALPSAPAQKSESPVQIASLSGSTIQSEFFLSSARERTGHRALRPAESVNWRIIAPQRALTDREAWDQFEAEFGPQHPSRSPLKRRIESAKYGLDVALFAFSRLSKNAEDNAEFRPDQGQLRRVPPGVTPPLRASGNLWKDALENGHVKLDLKTLRNQPYVGVRLVIPFGN